MKTTPSSERAFSRVDLLALLSVLALLAIAFGADGQSSGRAAVCQNNMRLLMRAQFLYAADNGYFPPNAVDIQTPGSIWVGGNVSFGSESNLNSTMNSMLSVYLERDPRPFKCPSAPTIPRSRFVISRSVSMNHAVGTDPMDTDGPCKRPVPGMWLDATAGHQANSKFRCFARPSDIVNPSPENLFIFVDEHQDSVNDAVFASMGPATPGAYRWIDVPAAYHDGSGSFGFADGRAQLHQWVQPFVPPSRVFPVVSPTPGQRLDLQWLAEHTSALRAAQP